MTLEKISIADSIILKPGSLTRKEWQAIKRHYEVGYRIAESSIELLPIAKGIFYHATNGGMVKITLKD